LTAAATGIIAGKNAGGYQCPRVAENEQREGLTDIYGSMWISERDGSSVRAELGWTRFKHIQHLKNRFSFGGDIV